jgi:hypothetical protein
MITEILNPSSYYLNFYSFPPLLVGIICLILGIYILMIGKDKKISTYFFIFSVSVFIWLGSYALAFASNSADIALLWGNTVYLGLVFLFPSLYSMSVGYLNLQKQRKFIPFVYAVGAIYFMIVFFTPYFLIGMKRYYWGYYPLYPTGYFTAPTSFMLLFIFIGVTIIINYVIGLAQEKSEIGRTHKKLLFFAHFIGYFACVDFIAKYGVELFRSAMSSY